MIVCITEKPSVAKDIAAILGATSKRDGYFEGGEYLITWTLGHLCTLKEPADYTPMWRRWALGSLPMLPPKFGIKLIPEKSIEHQFSVIERLIGEASEVINCGDAGQEGELIQRWVMQKAGVKCPVKRLWISSLTDESIRKGFQELKPEGDFNNLYHAGLARAMGDWILGMNATRLYTLKYGQQGNVLSIGRVQTPTLALIVQRHHEIVNFVPENFWELKTVYRDVTFNATSGRYKEIEKAQEVLEQITGKPFVITDVTEKKGREAPPRLFDLTSLQVECNRRWGMTAEETLRNIQSLYEKKVTTYPRVDTTYLSDDIYPKVPGILQKMTPYAAMTAPVLASKLPKSKKVFDNSKVTDHHAIIPTGESPAALVGDERKLYHLIATRFIAAFYPDCQFMQTTVLGEVEKHEFKATGKVITEPGWRKVLQPTENGGDNAERESDDKILPPFTCGESGDHVPALVTKTTQPPKYSTEGTLLRAMETAGKTIDDDDLRDAMKENGIGRPSTRAAIIETLFKRRYIYRERKNIMAAQAGIDLIATIREELLKSAKLTGIWENKLRRIERGDYSAGEFIGELKEQITEIVNSVMRDNSSRRIITGQLDEEKDRKPAAAKKQQADGGEKKKRTIIKSLDQIVCPSCGTGHIVKGRTAYGCSNYANGCKVLFPFDQYPADLTPAKLATQLKKLRK